MPRRSPVIKVEQKADMPKDEIWIHPDLYPLLKDMLLYGGVECEEHNAECS